MRSSALNAARALVHRWLAHAERSGPGAPICADVFASDARIVAPTGGFAAEFAASNVVGESTLALEFEVTHGRLVAEHRDGSDGGRLTATTLLRDDGVRHAPGGDSWARNRALAFAHRWLWAWEHAADSQAFLELLDPRGLEARLGEGLHARSSGEFLAMAGSLDASVRATHHVLRAVEIETNAPRYDVRAEIDWRGESAGGTPLRARTRHVLALRETDGRFPVLERFTIEVVEPVEPDLVERAEDPSLANAPSDDAESGGA